MSLLRLVAVFCLLAVAAKATDCPDGTIVGVNVTVSYWASSPTTVTATLAYPGGSATDTRVVDGAGSVSLTAIDECVPIGCYSVSVTASQGLAVTVEGSMDWNERTIFLEYVEGTEYTSTICFNGCANEVLDDNYLPKCGGGACVPSEDSLDYECECEGDMWAWIAVHGPRHYIDYHSDDTDGSDDSTDMSADSADMSADSADGSADSADMSADSADMSADTSDDGFYSMEYLWIWGNDDFIEHLYIEEWSYREYSICASWASCPNVELYNYYGPVQGDIEVYFSIFGEWHQLENYYNNDDERDLMASACFDDPCEVLNNECDEDHSWCQALVSPVNETYDYYCECEQGWTYDECDHPVCASTAGYLELKAFFESDVSIEVNLDDEFLYYETEKNFQEYFCSNGTFDVELVLVAVDGDTTGFFQLNYNWMEYAKVDVELMAGVQQVFTFDFNPCSPERICRGHGECSVDDSGNWPSCDCEDGYTGWSCESPICEEGVEQTQIVVYGSSPTISLVGDSGNVAVDEEAVYEYEGTYFCTPVECYTLTLKAEADFPTNSSIYVYGYFNDTDVLSDSVVIGADKTGSIHFCLNGDNTDDSSSTGSNDDDEENDDGNDANGAARGASAASVGSIFALLAAVASALRF